MHRVSDDRRVGCMSAMEPRPIAAGRRLPEVQQTCERRGSDDVHIVTWSMGLARCTCVGDELTTELHRPTKTLDLPARKIEDYLAEPRPPTSYLRTACVMSEANLLTIRADLACELRHCKTPAAWSSTRSASVDHSDMIETLKRTSPLASRTGVDITQQIQGDVPIKVKNDLTMSSVACHGAVEPSMDTARLVREGVVAVPPGEIDEGSFSAPSHILDSSKLATVARLLGSWDIGGDPGSWREVHALGDSHPDQHPGRQPIRKRPLMRLPSHPMSEPPPSVEPSATAIPVVLPSIPELRPNASLPVRLTDGEAHPSVVGAQTQTESGAHAPRLQIKRKPITQKRRPGGF